MSDLSQRLIFWVVFTVAIVLAVLWGIGLTPWDAGGQPLYDQVVMLRPGKTWRERLGPLDPGVYRVDVGLARAGVLKGQIELRLTGDAKGADLVTVVTIPASAVEDITQVIRRPNRFATFQLPKPTQSARHEVWLWLTAETDGPVALRCASLHAFPLKEIGPNEAQNGVRLAFRVYYWRSFVDNFLRFVGRFVQGRPGLLTSPWVYVALGTMHSAIVAWLVVWGADLVRKM